MGSKRRNSSNGIRQVNSRIADLPPEIIYEILFRLTIESVLTCRVVCKTWCAMTRDPHFINKFGSAPKHPTRLILKPMPGENGDTPSHLLLVDIEERKSRRIPTEKTLMDLHIMGSCNGFLGLALPEQLNPVVVYNPITRQQVVLPASKSKAAITCHEVGLGFDPSTNKYKVVRAYTVVARRNVRRFEIISLGDHKWRKLSPPQSIVKSDGYGVEYWNGALYWTTIKKNFITIVQFDISDEEFRVISLPEYFPMEHASMGFFEIEGCLTLVQNKDSVIELWRLTGNKDGGELSLCLKDTYDTHVKWHGGLCCEFLCEVNKESFLLQVGFWDCQACGRKRMENLSQYFPEKNQYSHLAIDGLPNSFKTVCMKPNLIIPPPGPRRRRLSSRCL